MKNKETEYLNNLFASSCDELDESEVDFPLVDAPASLSEKLYAITEPELNASRSTKKPDFGSWSNMSWPKVTSIAASLLIAVVLMQVYQQQQTLKQLKQAQTDLATALHYLGEANKITQAQMFNSINANMKKAAVAPVLEVGRDAVLPNLKSPEPLESLEAETKTPTRRL